MHESTTQDTTLEGGRELTAVIGGQHARVRELFSAALTEPPERRRVAFGELARFLAIHEAAEQEALHLSAAPAADSDMTATTGDSTAEEVSTQRLREEESAAHTLERPETLDSSSGSFRLQLELLQEAVTHHADAEETQEIPRLVAEASAAQLARVVATLRRVEDLAADISDAADVPVGVGFTAQLAAARRAVRGPAAH